MVVIELDDSEKATCRTLSAYILKWNGSKQQIQFLAVPNMDDIAGMLGGLIVDQNILKEFNSAARDVRNVAHRIIGGEDVSDQEVTLLSKDSGFLKLLTNMSDEIQNAVSIELESADQGGSLVDVFEPLKDKMLDLVTQNNTEHRKRLEELMDGFIRQQRGLPENERISALTDSEVSDIGHDLRGKLSSISASFQKVAKIITGKTQQKFADKPENQSGRGNGDIERS